MYGRLCKTLVSYNFFLLVKTTNQLLYMNLKKADCYHWLVFPVRNFCMTENQHAIHCIMPGGVMVEFMEFVLK